MRLIGTVNIHPSLLPQYRGAAPVQRALQVFVVLFTFKPMIYLFIWTIEQYFFFRWSGWCNRNRSIPCLYCSCVGCWTSDCIWKSESWWVHKGGQHIYLVMFNLDSWNCTFHCVLGVLILFIAPKHGAINTIKKLRSYKDKMWLPCF